MESRQVYGAVLAATGLVLAAVQVVHAVGAHDDPIVVAVEAVPMAAVALAFAYTGWWLSRRETYEPDLSRVAAWSAGGAVAFLSFGALTLFTQNVASGQLVRAPAVAVDTITVGATAGLLVGLYDARSRDRLRDLEAERDRVAAFGRKAADLNNYGRAIAGCDAVAGVSAFCIQAVSTLLGYRETAFVEVSDGAMNVVGDTTVGLDRETLRGVVEETLGQEVGAVVVHGDGDASDGDTSRESDGNASRESERGDATDRTALTVLVTQRESVAAVLVSVTDDPARVAEEDRQLLELLVAHAGTTLDGMYATGAG